MYGKATQTAIAALSRLAEVYDEGKTRLSASEIAKARGLQQPFVSKVLSTLSQAGIIEGTRGPGGGFSFARHPREVKLHDVYSLFEQDDDSETCPIGGGICGSGVACPLHARLSRVIKANQEVLQTNFEIFRSAWHKRQGNSPWRRTSKSE